MSKLEQKTSLVVSPIQELQMNVINNDFTRGLINRGELSQQQVEDMLLFKLIPIFEDYKEKGKTLNLSPLSVAQVINETARLNNKGIKLELVHWVPFKDKLKLIKDVRCDMNIVLDAYNDKGADRIDTFVVSREEIITEKYSSKVAPKRQLFYNENIIEDKNITYQNIDIKDNRYYEDIIKKTGADNMMGILVVMYDDNNQVMNFELYKIPVLVRILKLGNGYYNGEWNDTCKKHFLDMLKKTAIKKFCKFLALKADRRTQEKMIEILETIEEIEEFEEGEIVTSENKIQETCEIKEILKQKVPKAIKQKVTTNINQTTPEKTSNAGIHIDGVLIKDEFTDVSDIPEVIHDATSKLSLKVEELVLQEREQYELSKNEIKKCSSLTDEEKQEMMAKLDDNFYNPDITREIAELEKIETKKPKKIKESKELNSLNNDDIINITENDLSEIDPTPTKSDIKSNNNEFDDEGWGV